MTSIYLLTVFTSDGKRKRVWGWYPTYDEAETAILEDHGSMSECVYEWLVMERVGPGVGAIAEVCQWSKWGERGWSLLTTGDMPTWAKRVCNFGMG